MTYMMRLTAIGAAKITAAAAGLRGVKLTQMAVGDANGNPVSAPTGTELKLVREVYRTNLNSLAINTNDPTLMLAEMSIPSDVGNFAINEVGVYDADGDLFAYANFPTTWKPVPADGSSRDMLLQAALNVGNSSVVTLVVDGNLMIATRQWVLATITAGYLLPGGTTGQIARKRSNAPGDIEWADLTNINVTVDMIEETQTLVEGQNVVDWAIVSHVGLAIYVEGVRMRSDHWAKDPELPNRITLAHTYPAGTKIVGVQNEPAGSLPDPLVKARNLADVPDKAAARANLNVLSATDAQQLMPPGTIIYYAGDFPPPGFVKANFAALSRTIYAALFARIGTRFGAGDGSTTFNVPDLRGEFVRGWDDGRGLDPGREFGSVQAGQNLAHSHGGRTSSSGSHEHTGKADATGAASTGSWLAGGPVKGLTAGQSQATNNLTGLGTHSHNLSINAAGSHSHPLNIEEAGGTEARPRNVALLACIKY